MQGSATNNNGTQGQATRTTSNNSNGGYQEQPVGSNRPTQQEARQFNSLRSSLGRSSLPFTRQPSSEYLNQLATALREVYKSNAPLSKYEWNVIALDHKNTTHINTSVIIITLFNSQQPENGVGYHALIIEADSQPFREDTEIFMNQTYDVQKFASDWGDERLIGYLKDEVKLLNPGRTCRYADLCVVPFDFNIADKQQLYVLAENAIQAVSTELYTKSKDFNYLNLSYIGNDPTLQVRTSFNQPETIDALGTPVRSDIVIEFRSVPENQPNRNSGIENTERTENFSIASGFVDFTYDPVIINGSSWNQPQQRVPGDSALYSARIVLTRLDSMNDINNAMQILALTTAFPLLDSSSNPWAQDLLPFHLAGNQTSLRKPKDGFNPRDIGAFNYEAKIPDPKTGIIDRISTNTAEFDHQQFYNWMSLMVRQGVGLSIDVPDAGDSTWYNRIITELVSPTLRGGVANPAWTQFIEAANALTNGEFDREWVKTSRNILVPNIDVIQLGYYYDSDGVKRDIRNIDLLYMLNKYGHSDGTIGQLWTDTFTNVNRSMNINLAIRRQMIESCVGKVTWTGRAKRLTFHTDFINSVNAGCKAAGLHTRVVSQGTDTRSFQRGSYGLAGAGGLNTGFHSTVHDRSYNNGSRTFTGYQPLNNTGRF